MTEGRHHHVQQQARALAEGLNRLSADPAAEGLRPALQALAWQAGALTASLTAEENPPAATDPAGLDPAVLEGLIALAGPEMAPALLSQIRIDLREAGDGIASGIDRADWEQIRRHSHVLISVAGSVGAMALHHRAEAVNSAAHARDLGALRHLAADIGPAIARINDRLACLVPPVADPISREGH